MSGTELIRALKDARSVQLKESQVSITQSWFGRVMGYKAIMGRRWACDITKMPQPARVILRLLATGKITADDLTDAAADLFGEEVVRPKRRDSGSPED